MQEQKVVLKLPYIYLAILLIVLILQLANFIGNLFLWNSVFNANYVFGFISVNLLWLLSIAVIVLCYLHLKKVISNLSFVLILGGALSNMLDRIFRGGVIDYLKLPLIPFFNLADILIVAGSIIFFFDLIKKHPPSS